MFLYIDPLKQGLKPEAQINSAIEGKKFLYIDPLKQGLKHNCRHIFMQITKGFYT